MVQIVVDNDVYGKITKATLGVSRLFGYNEDELIGRNITILIPPPYSRYHDNFLTSYLETGNRSVIRREN